MKNESYITKIRHHVTELRQKILQENIFEKSLFNECIKKINFWISLAAWQDTVLIYPVNPVYQGKTKQLNIYFHFFVIIIYRVYINLVETVKLLLK